VAPCVYTDMKKLLALLIVGGVAWFAYGRFIKPPEKRACQRLAALCGDDADAGKCVKDIADIGKMSQEALGKLDSCVADARSCGEATGCLFGAGLGAAGSMFNDFMKGVGKSLPR
jgi:hypothetical protein